MKHLKKLILALSLSPLLACAQQGTNADDSTGMWDTWKRNIKETWASPTRDLYVPLNTWHNRWAYSQEKIDSYNERPWGIGYGVSRFDKDGDWHSLYAMEFQDSHNQFEPIFGYGYQSNWYFGQHQDIRLGLGFTAAITMRHDYSYIPVPLVLPMFSAEYKRFSIQNVYIPGTRNNGNVLFTWARWQIN
jgi:palmitoyl transferase